MIRNDFFFNLLLDNDISFFTGIPDSSLKHFCSYVNENSSKKNHIIAANEGGAIALATGYYLASKKIPLVYLQNSGQGNAVNPLTSLADKEVYGIPILLLIGWRGKPGVSDEPQHIKQGKITIDLLKLLSIPYEILSSDEFIVKKQVSLAIDYMNENSSPFALVADKNSFEPYISKNNSNNNYTLSREESIITIVDCLNDTDLIISTTGKTSRELFDYREQKGLTHKNDFLTVGSMGHASQIALGVALFDSSKRIFCFDGDGAALMHLGGFSIIGQKKPDNFIHIVFNNGAHESVGGQPTAAFNTNLCDVALACGYSQTIEISSKEELKRLFTNLDNKIFPLFVECKIKIGSRSDLGRPTLSPKETKKLFMNNFRGLI